VPRPLPVLLAIANIAWACGASPPPAGSGQSPGAVTQTVAASAVTGCAGDASAEDVARARALIDATDTGNQLTLAALQDIRFTSAGTVAACQRLAEGAVGDALWAATWIYVTSGTEPTPLLPLLANDDASVRVLAAAGLTSLGRLEGLDALVDSITVDAGLRGSLPPLTVSQFAAATLSRYTDAAVDDAGTSTPEERTAAAAAWSSWLVDNRDRLSFDREQLMWAVK
jgi:hypothetical protein